MPDAREGLEAVPDKFAASWLIQNTDHTDWGPCGEVSLSVDYHDRHRLPDLLRALARELEAQFAERGEGLGPPAKNCSEKPPRDID